MKEKIKVVVIGAPLTPNMREISALNLFAQSKDGVSGKN